MEKLTDEELNEQLERSRKELEQFEREGIIDSEWRENCASR